MLLPLHHRVYILALISCFVSTKSSGQAQIQYAIADIEYVYELRLENVTDADDVKLPKAILYDLLGTHAVFNVVTQSLIITSRINKSRPEFISLFTDHDYTILEWKKQSHNKTANTDE